MGSGERQRADVFTLSVTAVGSLVLAAPKKVLLDWLEVGGKPASRLFVAPWRIWLGNFFCD